MEITNNLRKKGSIKKLRVALFASYFLGIMYSNHNKVRTLGALGNRSVQETFQNKPKEKRKMLV